jgi:hypothetical protein
VVQQLLQAGAEIDAKTAEHQLTPLHCAARVGCSDVVQQLLQAGAQVNFKAVDSSATPLHFAAQLTCSNVALLLLQAGAGANARTADDEFTPLHAAAGNGCVQTAEILLHAGADVDAKTASDSRRALHLAALQGEVHMVELLLRHGASINRGTATGATALTEALSQLGCWSAEHLAVVQLLLNKGAAVSADTLLYAAEQSDSEGVLLLVGALGPAADASVLSDACRSAAAASHMENTAVLLKQLCMVDLEAKKLVVSGLSQPQDAAAACVAVWIAETRDATEQQQRLQQQQRQVAAERLAVQQLVVATAGIEAAC